MYDVCTYCSIDTSIIKTDDSASKEPIAPQEALRTSESQNEPYIYACIICAWDKGSDSDYRS